MSHHQTADTSDTYEERPPICPACGVTMVPAVLSAHTPRDGDWICLECEETYELDVESWALGRRSTARRSERPLEE
jgi:tRNA(Ile2) C34 agmatinyltransferase TiaS